jgi:hypothetical protein
MKQEHTAQATNKMKLYAVSEKDNKESTFFYVANSNKEAKLKAYHDGMIDCDYINLRCFCIKGIDIEYKEAGVLFYDKIDYKTRSILNEKYGFYAIY